MTPAPINRLKEFDSNKQLAFAYLTCERLYPNYVYFSNESGFGDCSVLREARVEGVPDVGYWKTTAELKYDQKVYQLATQTNGIISLSSVPNWRVISLKRIK